MRANFNGAEILDRRPAQNGVNDSDRRQREAEQAASVAAAVVARGNLDDAALGRSADPLRRYLQEIASAELLSREREVALAQRIEGGRRSEEHTSELQSQFHL